MLNDDEQRELATIEELLLGDPELSACFERVHPAVRPSSPRPRCLIVPGGLIMAAAVFLGLGATFAQGLGLLVLGLVWWIVTNAGVRRRMSRALEYCIKSYERSWLPPGPY